jgi:hypothetical protein
MMKGKPCGGSFIHSGYECRVETSLFAPSSDALASLKDSDRARVEQKINQIRSKVAAALPESAHGMWDQALDDFLKENEGSTLPSALRTDSMLKTLARVDSMVGNQPKQLSIAGRTIEAPVTMTPVIRKKQLSWEDDALGTKFLLPDKNGVAEVKGTSLGKYAEWQAGHTKAMLEFRDKQLAAGKPWPAESDSNLKISADEIKKLSAANPDLWKSGFNILDPNKNRDEAFTVYALNNKTPSKEQLEARLRKNEAVAEAWLRQGKKSPVTGRDIPLPAGNVKDQLRVVVDHLNAITGIRDQVGGDQWEMVRRADTASNYVIVETALNNSKGNRTWDWTAQNAYFTDRVIQTSLERLGKRPPDVRLSRKQFVQRFGEQAAQENYDTPSARLNFAQRHEANRLASIFDRPASEMVPIVKSTKRSKVSRTNGTTVPRKTGPQARTMAKWSHEKLLNALREAEANDDTKMINKIIAALAMKGI